MVVDGERWGFGDFGHVGGSIFCRLLVHCPGLDHLVLPGAWLLVLLLGFPGLRFGWVRPFFHIIFLVLFEGIIFSWNRVVGVHVGRLIVLGLPGLVQHDLGLVYLGCDASGNEIGAWAWGLVGLVLRMVQETSFFGFNNSFVFFLGPDLADRVLAWSRKVVLAVDALDLIDVGLAIGQLCITLLDVRPVWLCVGFILCNWEVYWQGLASCSV